MYGATEHFPLSSSLNHRGRCSVVHRGKLDRADNTAKLFSEDTMQHYISGRVNGHFLYLSDKTKMLSIIYVPDQKGVNKKKLGF